MNWVIEVLPIGNDDDEWQTLARIGDWGTARDYLHAELRDEQGGIGDQCQTCAVQAFVAVSGALALEEGAEFTASIDGTSWRLRGVDS